MTDIILALNAGSSSIKFTLYRRGDDAAGPEFASGGQINGIGNSPRLTVHERTVDGAMEQKLPDGANHEEALHVLLDWINSHTARYALVAAGHRVVHGGAEFSLPVLIDRSVISRLETLIPLAPLHQPHNLTAIRQLGKSLPDLPQVACFDTGFHTTNSNLATAFALPRELSAEGMRRYGFHGLSYEYIADTLPSHAGAAAEDRVVVAHLGHGASMCAMRARRSVATTMGMTALDGLPMGRRCGALDPGVILFLMKERGMDYDTLSDLLYERSGLLGVSGISDDMRELLESRAETAREAIDLFVYRIGRELGSLAAALGGLDVLVFTGGIGENAASIREAVCRNAEWLGVELDVPANEDGRMRISTPDSAVDVFTIPTDEDLVIARQTLALVSGQRAGTFHMGYRA